jgi:hypothetical protein
MDEPYPLGITDATPLIDKLRSSGAEAAFPLSYLNDSLFIIRTMRRQRITIPVIGGPATSFPTSRRVWASLQRMCFRSRLQTTISPPR